MNRNKQRILPPAVHGDKIRQNQKLRNEILKLLDTMKVGWSPDVVSSTGERFLRQLTTTLWYLDSHHGKFQSQNIPLPQALSPFQGYNDYKSKKEKQPRLSQDGLKSHMESLSAFLMQPWLSHFTFTPLREVVNKLADCMYKYMQYLQRHNENVKEYLQSTEPVRNPDEYSEMRKVPTSSCPIPEEFAQLEKVLSSSPDYQLVCLNDFAPSGNYDRKQWLLKLALPYPFRMYQYAHGNQLGTVSFVWKLPVDKPEDESALAHVLSQLSRKQNVYAAREMKRQFLARHYHRAAPLSKSELRHNF